MFTTPLVPGSRPSQGILISAICSIDSTSSRLTFAHHAAASADACHNNPQWRVIPCVWLGSILRSAFRAGEWLTASRHPGGGIFRQLRSAGRNRALRRRAPCAKQVTAPAYSRDRHLSDQGEWPRSLCARYVDLGVSLLAPEPVETHPQLDFVANRGGEAEFHAELRALERASGVAAALIALSGRPRIRSASPALDL